METIELMDIYAMDRGICRIVARMTHENLNPLCHKRYNSLNLKPRNELTRMGLQEESVTQELVFSILENHRRITCWESYKHNLECLEEMLVEYENTTYKTHSHDAIVPCLQRRVEADLNFSKEGVDVSKLHPRLSYIRNYLSSQVNRRFSTILREWKAEPDSYQFLTDSTYQKAAQHWLFTSESFGFGGSIN